MLSVFQIFKMILGIVVFIFIMTFFLQITNMYTGIGERSESLEYTDAFDKTVKQTFLTGNPGTFQGFEKSDFVVYDPPKIKLSDNQKSLSVTTFVIPGKGGMELERDCDDYGWYRFCWVYAYPNSSVIIFTPLENTGEVRTLINDTAAMLPYDMKLATCSGAKRPVADKETFRKFVEGANGMMDESYEECTEDTAEGLRLVTITSDTGMEPGRNEIILIPSGSGGSYKENVNGLWKLTDGTSDTVREGTYDNPEDVYFLLTTGQSALDYKEEALKADLKIAASVMRKRVILIMDMMEEYNIQPCNECPTPFPKACGYKAYEGNFVPSSLYSDLKDALHDLIDDLESDSDYAGDLARTSGIFEQLVEEGCEK